METQSASEGGDVKNPRVEIETSLGTMAFELYPEIAPLTTQNFLDLVRSGFYEKNPSLIYRIIPGFVAQGGPLSGENEPIQSASIKGEFGEIKHVRGVLSMARSEDVDSASCYFFICLGEAERLNGKYASFGQLVTGEDVLSIIEKAETTDGLDGKKTKPIDPIRILKVEVV